MNADDINTLGVKLEEIQMELEELDAMFQTGTAYLMTMMDLTEAMEHMQELEQYVRTIQREYDEWDSNSSDAGLVPLSDYTLKHGE